MWRMLKWTLNCEFYVYLLSDITYCVSKQRWQWSVGMTFNKWKESRNRISSLSHTASHQATLKLNQKSTKYILSIISVCIARYQHISSHLLYIFAIKMDYHHLIFPMSFRVQLIQTNTSIHYNELSGILLQIP